MIEMHGRANFLLFRDQLAESGRQKTKKIIVPRGKFRLVENSLKNKLRTCVFLWVIADQDSQDKDNILFSFFDT